MPEFKSSLIVVADVARSRAFYEGLLGQEVEFDFGVNVSFKGGFAIHERTHFAGLLGEGFPLRGEGAWGELYFEEDALPELETRLREAGARFVHGLREQPWAQRVFRCLDPDGHVVEVGETMPGLARRLAGTGMDVDAIAGRTGLPAAYVRELLS